MVTVVLWQKFCFKLVRTQLDHCESDVKRISHRLQGLWWPLFYDKSFVLNFFAHSWTTGRVMAPLKRTLTAAFLSHKYHSTSRKEENQEEQTPKIKGRVKKNLLCEMKTLPFRRDNFFCIFVLLKKVSSFIPVLPMANDQWQMTNGKWPMASRKYKWAVTRMVGVGGHKSDASTGEHRPPCPCPHHLPICSSHISDHLDTSFSCSVFRK